MCDNGRVQAKLQRAMKHYILRGKIQKRGRKADLSIKRGKGVVVCFEIATGDSSRSGGIIDLTQAEQPSEDQSLVNDGEDTHGNQSLDDYLEQNPRYQHDKETDLGNDEDDGTEVLGSMSECEMPNNGQEGDIMGFQDDDIASTPSKHLLTLPRELRDEILRLALKLDAVSDHEFLFNCPSKPCAGRPRINHVAAHEQFVKARRVLTTCKQIHDEGIKIFFEVNSWTLHRARHNGEETFDARALRSDTQRMFARFGAHGRRSYVRYFQHFDMQIAIAPLALVDVPSLTDTTQVAQPLDLRSIYSPAIIRRHSLSEAMQCRIFQEALDCFADCQNYMFQRLRTFTLSLSLHSPALPPPRNPISRCGVVLRVKVFLQEDTSEETKKLTLQQLLLKQQGKIADLLGLEPRRRMLVPLEKLRVVQGVEVCRKWTVRYHQRKDSGDSIIERAMCQRVRYGSVRVFLQHAGANYENFQVTGLEHLKVPATDLIEIIEDEDDDDDVRELVPTVGNPAVIDDIY